MIASRAAPRAPVWCPSCGGPGKIETDWRGETDIACDAYVSCGRVLTETASQLSSIEREIEDKQSEIDDLQLDIDNLEDEIEALRQKAEKFRGPKPLMGLITN